MKKSIGFLLISLGLGFLSCNNEVDLTGEYKDTPVVYCLLNPGDTAHYIRIQKAFLINGNVLQTAQIPDSLKYDPADLEVKIQPLDQNTGNPVGAAILFQHQPNAVQDTGVFASGGIMIYKSTAALNDLRKYRLEINNTKLNKQITSQTGLIYMPNPVNSPFFITPGAGTVIFNPISGAGYTLRWRTPVNGFVFQPEITFRWTEVDLNTNISTPDSVVWKLTPKEITTTQPPTEMDYNLAQNSFYRYVGETVPEKPSNIKRVIGGLVFRFYVGTEELNTYMNVNKPSIGLIQEKPVYTNIDGGLGVFAGRTTFTRTSNMAEASKDTLIFSPYTDQLNFKKQ